MAEEFFEQEESLFNMSVAILKRIDGILNSCVYARLRGEFLWWYESLDTLIRQIPKRTEKENKQILELKINAYRELTLWLINGKKRKIGGKLIENLNNFEDYLRDCLDKRKMLMSDKPSPYGALGRM